jgi:GR25 family glycosyltransferase involved in LPS biosynthesis
VYHRWRNHERFRGGPQQVIVIHGSVARAWRDRLDSRNLIRNLGGVSLLDDASRDVPGQSILPPVYVISLARCHERRTWMHRHLGSRGLAFEACDAVDGRNLASDDACPLTRGERACYLSHVGVWQRLLSVGSPGAFVLEDDVQLLPGCSVSLLAEVVRLTRPGEVVLLQSSATDIWRWQRRRLSSGSGFIGYTLGDTLLASAYYLTREGALALVKRWEREGMRFCVDHWYWRRAEQPAWAGTLPILVLQPNLVTQQDAFASEIAALGRVGTTGAAFSRPRVQRRFDGQWRHIPRDSLRVIRRQIRLFWARPMRVSGTALL